MSQTTVVGTGPGDGDGDELDVSLAAIAHHNHGAFNRFYALTLALAVQEARRYLAGAAQVGNAVQKAYLGVWLNASGDPPTNARGWLARIVANASLEILRSD